MKHCVLCRNQILKLDSRSQVNLNAVCVKSLQSCQTLCDPMDCNPPGSSVHGDSPGKSTGVGCHALLQGIFLNQGSNLCLLSLLPWQAGSLPLAFIMVFAWFWQLPSQGLQWCGRNIGLVWKIWGQVPAAACPGDFLAMPPRPEPDSE